MDMALHRDSVLEYAHSIPGLAGNDILFAALHSSLDARAVERCETLLSESGRSAAAHTRQCQMLRRLKTMIKLLGKA